MDEITAIVNKVGIDENDGITPKKLEKINNINNLSQKIEAKKQELEQKYDKYHNMKDSKTYNIATKTGITTGAAVGLGIAGYLVLGAATGGVGLLLGATVSGLVSACGSMFIGQKLGEVAGEHFESHDEKMNREQKNSFHDNEIHNLYSEIQNMEAQLKNLQEQFMSE